MTLSLAIQLSFFSHHLVNNYMSYASSNSLLTFTQYYIDEWQKSFGHNPKSADLYGISSPCITSTKDLEVFWLPVLTNNHSLNIVEEVINLTITPDAHLFYGTQYAGDMAASFNGLSLSLIQVWSEEDFSRLEQNLIAHLSMQKKLKRRPSIFIATTDDPTQLIAIDNLTGAIILEKLIENETEVLADNLDSFLADLKPIAQ